MDFEGAAQRLKKEHQNIRGRKPVAVSAKAKREAEYRKKQQEKIRQERQRQQKQQDFIDKYMKSGDRALGVKSLNSGSLTATSIWGEGDKIALPPSVLEFLTQSEDGTGSSTPWMFRIGVLREDYTFPASPLLQTLKPTEEEEEDESDEEHEHDHASAPYLDELKHKYVAYTHGTVVEFTQDEGHVGLPAPIAKSLLENNDIPTTRTKDPSATAEDDTMQVDDDDERTPGHVAYGAFDVPAAPIEILLLRLPKGKGCTLTPTPQAIQNGFYNLQNIKLVLEQSLIRTRATLSLGDRVQTWHRGVQFDLVVSKVTPSTYNAVTCINTDIEVEFGQVEGSSPTTTTTTTDSGRTLSSSPPPGGQTLSSSPPPPSSRPTTTTTTTTSIQLLPEPPAEQTENICTVQIRAERSGRRRFDIQNATMTDLFQFASTLVGDASKFRLVTRFPRKVYEKSGATMKEAGLQEGQELFMVERV